VNFFENEYSGYLVWRFILKKPRLRLWLQGMLYPHKTEFAKILGADIFIDTQKELGYYRAARNVRSNIVTWQEAPKQMALMTQIRAGTTFVDCGANVGLWSAQVGRMAAIVPGLRVLAFEANPDTFARLQRTCAALPGVRCFNVALSDKARTLAMVGGAASGVFGVHESEFQIGDRVQQIQALPLDDFLGDELIDLVLKVDVEGHELEVVKGAAKALARGAVRAILLDGILDRNRAELLALLTGHGFQLYDCDSLQPHSGDGDRVLAIRA
jgi:FkbM family methyltransferase